MTRLELLLASLRATSEIAAAQTSSPVRAEETLSSSASAAIHDYRDRTGDPLVKSYDIRDWRSWERQQDSEKGWL